MFFKQLARTGLFQRLVNLNNARNVESIETIHTTATVSHINRMRDRKEMLKTVTERDDGAQGERTAIVEKRYYFHALRIFTALKSIFRNVHRNISSEIG